MKVMEGVRVLEIAEYAMAPSAGAVLAEWGADVIKVEHPERGDAIRSASSWGIAPGTGGFSFLFDPFNRGKRSVGIDLASPEGHELVLKLVRQADVFITNFLPPARARLKIDVADIQAVNPRVIYCRGSAHGPRGPEADRGGFDGSTFWLRSGLGMAAMPVGTKELVTLPGPAIGDIQTGMALAGGIAAAMFHRERSGQAPVVDVSLLASGVWSMHASLVAANISNQSELPHADHSNAPNPMHTAYRTRDGRFITLGMMRSDLYWRRFCELINRLDLVDDPRFRTFADREANNRACIAEFDAIFEQRTLAEWRLILAQQEGPWAVAQVVTELNHDEQVWANGYLQKVDFGEGRTLTLAPCPVQFNEEPPKLRPSPAHAAHTEEVCLELGLDWDDISRLKDLGAIS
jgi:crotonobetainyl-CoA:carnitine CoA-transferase CaiB-like acyl-CoA transferase